MNKVIILSAACLSIVAMIGYATISCTHYSVWATEMAGDYHNWVNKGAHDISSHCQNHSKSHFRVATWSIGSGNFSLMLDKGAPCECTPSSHGGSTWGAP